MQISLIEQNEAVPIVVEQQGLAGVRKIAEIISEDIALVTGKRPVVTKEKLSGTACILCATIGHSPLLEQLAAEGRLELSDLTGAWEVYRTVLLRQPWEGMEQAIVIIGSDQRGTTYGMFSLSEYLGVSPYVFWGDAAPAQQEAPVVTEAFCRTSKEPSVRYRGFFINDEWPCYGNWVMKHYGGFTAESYEKVFELLLRMKGNYLWPAMWSSSFPLDGPGGKNEELANLYGVVMGYSHHEPCLRASEEWDQVRGVGTRYGNEWNFAKNREGLLHYWEDALIRSGAYDNVITVGMRGERDTSMLGEDSSMAENIELLKQILTEQKRLIHAHVHPFRPMAPMMLALYKEVEQYFYGNDEVAGLKDWEGLKDIICMFCEDNFGHMRTLPTRKMRQQHGKFGMYYHLDYHGGPVSYEWVDSTSFTKIWEQMCEAYEFGVRDIWIVNVGDIKFHEVPLGYFLSLAYDFDTWGSSNRKSPAQYVMQWVHQNFPEAGEELSKNIGFVLSEYISLNELRRPESLHAGIYHACHYLETDRLLARLDRLEETILQVDRQLPEKQRNTFYSCISYAARASVNNIRLHLYAGKNRHYAGQGRLEANRYKRLAEECLQKEAQEKREFAAFLSGKWDGMQLAAHIGFTKWNEDGSRRPVLSEVYPVERSRMNVSRKDEEAVYDKVYGMPMVISVPDFLWEGTGQVILEVANDGAGELKFTVSAENGELPDWLCVTPERGTVTVLSEVSLSVNREKLGTKPETALLRITDGDTSVLVRVSAKGPDRTASDGDILFYEQKGACIMRADHFFRTSAAKDGEWQVIEGYGKYGAGVKVFPVTEDFSEKKEAPGITYRFFAEKTGEYRLRLFTAPTNPTAWKGSLHLRVGVNGQSAAEADVLELVPSDFSAGENREARWCKAVLDQIRITEETVSLKEGINTVTVYPCEPGVVLQQIGVYQKETCILPSYLGQEESVWKN